MIDPDHAAALRRIARLADTRFPWQDPATEGILNTVEYLRQREAAAVAAAIAAEREACAQIADDMARGPPDESALEAVARWLQPREAVARAIRARGKTSHE